MWATQPSNDTLDEWLRDRNHWFRSMKVSRAVLLTSANATISIHRYCAMLRALVIHKYSVVGSSFFRRLMMKKKSLIFNIIISSAINCLFSQVRLNFSARSSCSQCMRVCVLSTYVCVVHLKMCDAIRDRARARIKGNVPNCAAQREGNAYIEFPRCVSNYY